MSNKPDTGRDNPAGLCIAFGVAGMTLGVLSDKSTVVIAGGFFLVFGALLRIDGAIRRQKAV